MILFSAIIIAHINFIVSYLWCNKFLSYNKNTEKPIQTLKMKTGAHQTDFKSSQLKQKEKLKSDRD
jgi:hypothetical protein